MAVAPSGRLSQCSAGRFAYQYLPVFVLRPCEDAAQWCNLPVGQPYRRHTAYTHLFVALCSLRSLLHNNKHPPSEAGLWALRFWLRIHSVHIYVQGGVSECMFVSCWHVCHTLTEQV
jgi:hypothetical protein